MSKKYENSIWSLCLMKYSLDGNPENMVTGYGVLFDGKDNEDAKRRLSPCNIFIPIETFISIGSNNPRRYKNKYFYYYECYFEISSKASSGRFFELADENMLTFNSLSELRKYIKGIEFYLISHNCKGMYFAKIYRGNISHSLPDGTECVESNVPLVMLPNGYCSIGNFLTSTDVVNYLLSDKFNGLLSFWKKTQNVTRLDIISSTDSNDNVISGNFIEITRELKKKAIEYIKSLVDQYNEASFGSAKRKKYKYLIESYLGKKSFDYLRNNIKYELYTGVIDGTTCYFIHIPGTDKYIKLRNFNSNSYMEYCLATVNMHNPIVARSYAPETFSRLNQDILDSIINCSNIDELRKSYNLYSADRIEHLIKKGDLVGASNLNNSIYSTCEEQSKRQKVHYRVVSTKGNLLNPDYIAIIDSSNKVIDYLQLNPYGKIVEVDKVNLQKYKSPIGIVVEGNPLLGSDDTNLEKITLAINNGYAGKIYFSYRSAERCAKKLIKKRKYNKSQNNANSFDVEDL